MRLIHCTDVHLGKGREGSDRFYDFGAALAQATAWAVSTRAEAFIISGDLFDSRDISPETLRLAVRALRPLRDAGIPAFAIEGNHDASRRLAPAGPGRVPSAAGSPSSWVRYLADERLLFTLSPAWDEAGEVVLDAHDPVLDTGAWAVVGGLNFVGLGFLGARAEATLRALPARLAELAAAPGAARATILIAHGAVGSASGGPEAGTLDPEALRAIRPHVAYVALGHLHSRVSFPADDPFVFNPGSLEFVRADDYRRPHRGFYDVNVDLATGRLAAPPRFVETDKRPIVPVVVDLETVATPEAATQAVDLAARTAFASWRGALPRPPIIVLRLRGLPRFPVWRLDRAALDTAARSAFTPPGVLEVRVVLDVEGAAPPTDHDAASLELDVAVVTRRALDALVRDARVVPAGREAALVALIERWHATHLLRSDADEPARREVFVPLDELVHANPANPAR